MTNTEEIKRLAEIIKSANITEKNSYSLSVAKAIFNAGYLPSSSVVSPLVWEDKVTFSWTKTVLGPEQVFVNPDNKWQIMNGSEQTYETREAAKEAVFLEYRTLIGSCLQGGGYSEAQVLRLIEGLKDYTAEGHVVLGHDERTPQEFLEIFKQKEAALKQQ